MASFDEGDFPAQTTHSPSQPDNFFMSDHNISEAHPPPSTQHSLNRDGDGDDDFGSENNPASPQPCQRQRRRWRWRRKRKRRRCAIKKAFYEKREKTIETKKADNREREKSELISREVPNIDKKRGKNDPDKKPSMIVIQGPKPGKPTDLGRMRQIFLKLKTNPPPHMMPPPPPAKMPKTENLQRKQRGQKKNMLHLKQ
ncbi:BnaA07g00560D [Brassica napus]|uniref:BnaA07g00560D protein n=1 Tax=Brassica napus TaxID=3708 RepID=A0A078H3F1_BRANA|nr:BnaA07g00560D [Brassica napus]